MKYILLLVVLVSSTTLWAQRRRTNPGPISFPRSFMGNWEGTLQWYPTGKPSQAVPMQLNIQRADTAGQYTWQLIYGKAGEDNRPYLLKPADTTGIHWVIDENNGIILDSYWVGQRFTGAFTVQGNTILDNYWLQGRDTLHIEFFSFKQAPVATTGLGTEESPAVDSYRIGSYQKAVLTRRKKP